MGNNKDQKSSAAFNILMQDPKTAELLIKMGLMQNAAGHLDKASDEQAIKYFREFGHLMLEIADNLERLSNEGRSPGSVS